MLLTVAPAACGRCLIDDISGANTAVNYKVGLPESSCYSVNPLLTYSDGEGNTTY